MEVKTCSSCRKDLPLDMFTLRSKSKDGYDTMCKECKSKYSKEYREKNKDVLREKAKKRREDNKDLIKVKKREYYQANKEEILQKCAEYRRSHKEQKAASDKKYAQENKEKIQQYQQEYRDTHKSSNSEYQKQYRKKNKEKLDEYKKSPHIRYKSYQNNARNKDRIFELSEEDFMKITSQPCIYCGEYSDTYNGEQFNGIDRIDSNLGYSINNCAPCCATCNRMKMEIDVDDWINKMIQIINYFDKESLSKMSIDNTKFL